MASRELVITDSLDDVPGGPDDDDTYVIEDLDPRTTPMPGGC